MGGGERSKWGRIQKHLDGHKEIDLLRRLRKLFAHTSGSFKGGEKEHDDLRQALIEHFDLDEKDHPTQDGMFPIPIDTVLVPMGEGIKKYVIALHRYREQMSKLAADTETP